MSDKSKSNIIILIGIGIMIGLYANGDYSDGPFNQIFNEMDKVNRWVEVVEYPEELGNLIVEGDYTGEIFVRGVPVVIGSFVGDDSKQQIIYKIVNRYKFNLKKGGKGKEWELIGSEDSRADKITIKGIDITENISDLMSDKIIVSEQITDQEKIETGIIKYDEKVEVLVEYVEGEQVNIERAEKPEGWEDGSYKDNVRYNTAQRLLYIISIIFIAIFAVTTVFILIL